MFKLVYNNNPINIPMQNPVPGILDHPHSSVPYTPTSSRKPFHRIGIVTTKSVFFPSLSTSAERRPPPSGLVEQTSGL